jgi:hypothetical protein
VEFIDFFALHSTARVKLGLFSIIKLFLEKKKKNICRAFGFLFFLNSKIPKLGITTQTPKLIVKGFFFLLIMFFCLYHVD